MIKLEDLPWDRRKLILHRFTRAVAEKLQREDIMALFVFNYLEVTLHAPHNQTLEFDEFKKAYGTHIDMITILIKQIQHTRGFNWNQILVDILREEGVSEPSESDAISATLAFVQLAIES